MNARLVLEAVAITLVFTRGSIFTRLRGSGPTFWQELASCPLCIGVWVGWAWYALHLASRSPVPTTLEVGADLFASGPSTGVLALFVALLLSLLDRWS